jgi:hypothetical protein
VAPASYGLVTKPLTTSQRRSVIFLSKVVQNVASMVRFDKKEEFMQNLNSHIDKNRNKMKEFYSVLGTFSLLRRCWRRARRLAPLRRSKSSKSTQRSRMHPSNVSTMVSSQMHKISG